MTANLLLFLVTLLRAEKSQEIFKLTCICHISIRVEKYRAQRGITKCSNCQNFGHVWHNFSPPLFVVWGLPLTQEMLGKDQGNIYTGMI
jgi:hypothetical protein